MHSKKKFFFCSHVPFLKKSKKVRFSPNGPMNDWALVFLQTNCSITEKKRGCQGVKKERKLAKKKRRKQNQSLLLFQSINMKVDYV